VRHLVVLATCLVASFEAAAQERGARGGEKAAPQKSVRIVVWDGDQILTTERMFRWTDFVAPAATPAARGGRGDGGGRGEGGGGRGDGAGGRGNAFARAAGAFSTFSLAIGLDRSRDLGRLDRIEVDGDLEFQAKPPARTFARVNGTSYSGGYGGLAFDVPAGWVFADATDVAATVLKRANDGEIVGRVRVSIRAFGDGQSLRIAFDDQGGRRRALARRVVRRAIRDDRSRPEGRADPGRRHAFEAFGTQGCRKGHARARCTSRATWCSTVHSCRWSNFWRAATSATRSSPKHARC
jgi:hypothetical protein